ncbi:protein of unknown function [Paenibacillus sp. cl141a]|uniref:DUF4352 domain-containing protein n=1 Tax=Paenibacillus sp. cl141a TaxID=1761877 RepID=UPI0008AC3145|nr:DUF4352 domain-containing protein [Paenibacillus sp. cl141a]SEL43151.1 protein of unknown function [Paenibacillus sp. cl141a]
MRTKFGLILMICAFLVISACGNNTTSSDTPQQNEQSVDAAGETVKEEPSKEAATEPTKEEPKEVSNKPGEKFTLGDWEVVLDSFEFDQKVSADMFSSSADEGNKFLILNYTVTNNGKEAKDFTSIIGGVSMKAIFKEEYEYNYTVTMIDGDLGTGSIKPLATKSGFVVIEVPDSVADSKESLVVKLEDKDKAQITLR